MPLLNSMGIFRAMSILPTGTTPYYFNALNLTSAPNDGTAPESKNLTVINDKIYQYGYASTIVSSTYQNKPYICEYTTTGELNSYKVYATELYTEVSGFCIDSSGNKYVLLGRRNAPVARFKFRLLKYDSSDVLLSTIEVAGISHVGFSFGTCFGMKIDSSNNLYIGLNNWGYGASSGICVLKFDSSLSLVWSSQVNPSLIAPTLDNTVLNLDSSNNVIVTINDHRSSPSNDLNYVVKMNSSGIVQWTRQIVAQSTSGGRTCQTVVDSSNNIFVLMVDKIVKILANGTVSYKHSLTSNTYLDMYINSLGNLVLIDMNSIFAISKDDVAPKSSVLASTYYSSFIFDRVVSNGNYSFVLNNFSNGSVYTPSVIKVASNGYPPNIGAVASFSQIDDQGATNSWNETISISLDANISVTDATITVNNITTTGVSIATSITTVTQSTGSTVPTVYVTPLK